MKESEFRRLFQQLVEKYELEPIIAKRLLHRILVILYGEKGEELSHNT